MRKVKIPTSMNPFVVHVNGEKYVYPAGTEQEVTDAVANVIDAYIKKENQQPDPTESPFSTSWNDLKDKPFGETTVKGDTLTWDGNTEGLVSCTNAPFYKVSDAIPTRANCANGITITAFGGVETPVDGETAQGAFMEDGAAFFDVVFIIPCDNYDADGMVFPKAGVYFSNDGDGGMVSSFTIHNYTGFETTTIKPIETKYLPEHLQFGEEINYSKTLTWDGTESDTIYNIEDIVLHHVSDVVLTKDELRACSFTDNSGDGGACRDVYMFGNAIAFSSKCMIIPEDNFIIFDELEPVAKKGIYFIVQTSGDQKYYITSFTLPESSDKLFCDITVKTIDEKYMPTLTSPSGKKFKLSVDDSGVLSATEV